MIDLEYGVTITAMFIQSIDQITFITGLGYLSGFCWLPLLNKKYWTWKIMLAYGIAGKFRRSNTFLFTNEQNIEFHE